MQTRPSTNSTSTASTRATLRRLAVGIALPLLFAGVIPACDVGNLPGCFQEIRTDLAHLLTSTGRSLGSDVSSVKSFTTSNSAVMDSLRSALNVLNSVGPGGTFSSQVLQRMQDSKQLLTYLTQTHDPDYQRFLGAACSDPYCGEFRDAVDEFLVQLALSADRAGQLALAEAAASGTHPTIVFPTALDVSSITALVRSAPPALLFPLWKSLELVDVGDLTDPECSDGNTPCIAVRTIATLLERVATELPFLIDLYQQAAATGTPAPLGRPRLAALDDPASTLCGLMLQTGPGTIGTITTVVNTVGVILGAVGALVIADAYFLSINHADVGASIGAEVTTGATFNPGQWLGWISTGLQKIFAVTGGISETVFKCRLFGNQQLILCMQQGDTYDACYDDVLHQTPGRVLGF